MPNLHLNADRRSQVSGGSPESREIGEGGSSPEDSVLAVFSRVFRCHLEVSYRSSSIRGRLLGTRVLDQGCVGCSKQWALSCLSVYRGGKDRGVRYRYASTDGSPHIGMYAYIPLLPLSPLVSPYYSE